METNPMDVVQRTMEAELLEAGIILTQPERVLRAVMEALIPTKGTVTVYKADGGDYMITRTD